MKKLSSAMSTIWLKCILLHGIGSYVIAYFSTVNYFYMPYFVKHEAKGKKCYTSNEIIKILEFLIDNMYLSSSNGTFFNKSWLGIHMGANCAPLLQLFLSSYESESKNLKFVEDHPMNIHVQFGFNHICSFWEEGIWIFSHRVQC